jgi:hypothetical protein
VAVFLLSKNDPDRGGEAEYIVCTPCPPEEDTKFR